MRPKLLCLKKKTYCGDESSPGEPKVEYGTPTPAENENISRNHAFSCVPLVVCLVSIKGGEWLRGDGGDDLDARFTGADAFRRGEFLGMKCYTSMHLLTIGRLNAVFDRIYVGIPFARSNTREYVIFSPKCGQALVYQAFKRLQCSISYRVSIFQSSLIRGVSSMLIRLSHIWNLPCFFRLFLPFFAFFCLFLPFSTSFLPCLDFFAFFSFSPFFFLPVFFSSHCQRPSSTHCSTETLSSAHGFDIVCACSVWVIRCDAITSELQSSAYMVKCPCLLLLGECRISSGTT